MPYLAVFVTASCGIKLMTPRRDIILPSIVFNYLQLAWIRYLGGHVGGEKDFVGREVSVDDGRSLAVEVAQA